MSEDSGKEYRLSLWDEMSSKAWVITWPVRSASSVQINVPQGISLLPGQIHSWGRGRNTRDLFQEDRWVTTTRCILGWWRPWEEQLHPAIVHQLHREDGGCQIRGWGGGRGSKQTVLGTEQGVWEIERWFSILSPCSQFSPYSQVIRDWSSGLFMELLHSRSNWVTDFWGSGAKMQSAGLAWCDIQC